MGSNDKGGFFHRSQDVAPGEFCVFLDDGLEAPFSGFVDRGGGDSAFYEGACLFEENCEGALDSVVDLACYARSELY